MSNLTDFHRFNTEFVSRTHSSGGRQLIIWRVATMTPAPGNEIIHYFVIIRDFPLFYRQFYGFSRATFFDNFFGILWQKKPVSTVFWILSIFRRFFSDFYGEIGALTWQFGCVLKHILGPAIRAFRLTGLLDRQIHLRMRIPQVHARHRAGQWYVPALYLVAVPRISCNQILVNGSCSCCHSSHR